MKSISNRTLQKQLDVAGKICVQRKARLTPLRSALLKLIYQYDKPVSAYDLLKMLRQSHPHAEAMTVYRGLEFWMSVGVLHKLAGNNTYTACPHPDQDHFGQLLLCQRCGKSTEIQETNLSQLIKKVAEKNHFSIQAQLIEISGVCEGCSGSASS